MSDRLSQIASFHSGIPAQLARARLEAEGIQSFLTNELGSVAGGAVGLQVAETDAERARELLGVPGPRPDPRRQDGESVRCLMCRSSELESTDWSLPVRMLRALLLMALPLPAEWFTRSRTRCRNCGYEQPPS